MRRLAAIDLFLKLRMLKAGLRDSNFLSKFEHPSMNIFVGEPEEVGIKYRELKNSIDVIWSWMLAPVHGYDDNDNAYSALLELPIVELPVNLESDYNVIETAMSLYLPGFGGAPDFVKNVIDLKPADWQFVARFFTTFMIEPPLQQA